MLNQCRDDGADNGVVVAFQARNRSFHRWPGFHRPTLWGLLVVIGLLASGCGAPSVERPVPVGSSVTGRTPTTDLRPSSATTTPTAEVIAHVVSVTDGDTIRVLLPDGSNEPVRLIGIDAPEDGSLLDREATAYLEELVLGKDVRLVVDVSDRDRFDRLLRYVYLGELFVNEEVVRAGLAVAKRYEPDTAMASVLEAAQGGAEQAALGLFSPSATTTIATTTTLPDTTTAQANCHPSYPDFCIPPPPPDLDCGDIEARNCTVLPPDPHRFDGNNDGVGCET